MFPETGPMNHRGFTGNKFFGAAYSVIINTELFMGMPGMPSYLIYEHLRMQRRHNITICKDILYNST